MGQGGHVPLNIYEGGTSMVMSPNILEVMSFRMSTRVTATVVCCILTQILRVVPQKRFSSSPRPPTGAPPLDPTWGLSQTPFRGSTPGPRWGTSVPQTPVFFYAPPIIL